MQVHNGRFILGEPEAIGFPNDTHIGFRCSGLEFVMNNMTVLRLMSILQTDLTKKRYNN